MIFLKSPNLSSHAEVTLLAVTIPAAASNTRGFPCHRGEGLTSTQYPDQDTTDTRVRALSYFPYFLTHSSDGLTSCLIFCGRGCTLSRCLHRAVRGDPRVFFPGGYSSFKAQQRVRGARTAPSRASNPAFGTGDFHLPLWSSFCSSATFFPGLLSTGDAVPSPTASVPPTHCPCLFPGY